MVFLQCLLFKFLLFYVILFGFVHSNAKINKIMIKNSTLIFLFDISVGSHVFQLPTDNQGFTPYFLKIHKFV